jgi:diacylglycerol kinase (ATP)
MRKILFIINPIAGMRHKAHIPDLAKTLLERDRFEVHISFTSYRGHASQIARQAVMSGFNAVVAAGGDGSINEIASELVNTQVALGILPMGSGNGLAYKLNIPLDITKALHYINRYYIQSIDVGTMNDRYFFSTAGMGFEALIVQDFAQTKLRGLLGYSEKIIRRLIPYQAETFEVICNGKLWREKAFIVTVGNSGVYGYGIGMTAQHSNLSDGLLELTILRDFPRWKTPYILGMVANGKLNSLKEAICITTSDALIKTDQITFAQIDGEAIAPTNCMQIGVKHRALNVIV